MRSAIGGIFLVFLFLSVTSCGNQNSLQQSSLQDSTSKVSASASPLPGTGVVFIQLNAFNSRTNAKWAPVLKDIMNHEAPGDNDVYDDPMTLGHETSHGIHSYIRNHLSTSTARHNGFYVLQNRAVLVKEPAIRKSVIGPYVPTSLRGDRYATYVTGQPSWDDTPLYIWDEWNAYVNGSEVGVNQVESNLWNRAWQDGVAGTLEFVVYALASGMAVKDKDPSYFQNETQFREFLAWNIARSMTAFKKGSVMDAFKWARQDQYLQNLRTSADAAKMRDFARAQFGADWTQENLGF